MTKLGLRLFASLLAVLALSGCGKAKPTLHLYCWADYINPAIIKQFEKENNCRVVYDTFDSNEALYAKLKAGASGYDVIVPSHYIIDLMAKENMLLKLDLEKIPNRANFDEQILRILPDPECTYAAPYMMSYTGIGYNKEKVADFKASWNMFSRTDLKKRMTILDDKREVIGAALYVLGLDPNSTSDDALAAAKEIIVVWRDNAAKLENEQYKNGIASNEFYLVMGYSGDMMQVVEENAHVGFVIPEEGTLISCDMMAIPAQAKNIDLAHRFINFLHEPAIAAANTEHVFFLCPNKAAYPLLSEEIRTNPAVFLKPEILAKSKVTIDQGENEQKFNRLWEDIKAGK
ncbi:MAG TPA: spermidine/putrescine ABC transporter substrate-binding protein [Lentisphaeria bacterium]|nr:spermidine/putrescine ABC transporter substrate-binding protein [Lentisphaeria bacterium]